jgi:hypothetical protein
VTNSAGNLVDENGNQINGAFLTNHPGFPGFSPTPAQTLAYMADMQEAGIPVTYGYISDMHERKAGTSGCTTVTATSSGTQFDIEPQGAAIYVHGQPAANDPAVRQLERDTATMTGNNPFTGNPNEPITKYQAGALEQRVLHIATSDPLRTPTYTLFPMPDFFFGTSGPNVAVNSSFAYDHGYYSPNIDVTWAAFAGPGVAVRGVDGPQPAQGNESNDPNSTNTVPQASTVGTWVEETDIRPTLLHLVGLHDDYQSDGHVITQALTSVPGGLQGLDDLIAAYDQINSSVGQFATDTLLADSAALASGSAADDTRYVAEQSALAELATERDQLATEIKQMLTAATDGAHPNRGQVQSKLVRARNILRQADQLAATA